MQDLINAAVARGKAEYEAEQRKKVQSEEERLINEKIARAAKMPLAQLWVTEELPEIVTEQVRKDPNIKEIHLKTVIDYKNKFLSDDLLAEACTQLGLSVRQYNGSMRYYDEGPEEEYTEYYVILAPFVHW